MTASYPVSDASAKFCAWTVPSGKPDNGLESELTPTMASGASACTRLLLNTGVNAPAIERLRPPVRSSQRHPGPERRSLATPTKFQPVAPRDIGGFQSRG
jgi:hypothetical protein